MKKSKFASLAVWAAGLLVVGPAVADGGCPSTIGRGDVARCAAAASLDVRVEVAEAAVRAGRVKAVSPLLRSNPVVILNAARRSHDVVPTTTNWSATLSQELEIAGQRGARVRSAELESEAQGFRIEVARREAMAAAWTAYFDVLARADEQRLMARLSANASHIALVARGMADKGVLAPVDADVADAQLVNAEEARLDAAAGLRRAEVTLATLLGLPEAKATGDLTPLEGVEQVSASTSADGGQGSPRHNLAALPEAKAFAAEARAQESVASAYSRQRVPNPTLSIFAQNDGFNERVFGAGIAIPIPLPHPVGRVYSGEIAEAKAAATRATTESERSRRLADLALGNALASYEAAKAKRDLYTAERIGRAELDVEALAKELQAGRVNVRDALITQQALVSLLRASVEARHELCTTSVELARAANLPLDRGVR